MAARKEVLDFIMAERNTDSPPKREEVISRGMRIIEIYSERKADILTLKNDLFELVASAKIHERTGDLPGASEFEYVIMILLQTAKDWQLFLPEDEVKRYEGVKLPTIKNLAEYIRRLFKQQSTVDNEKAERFRDKYGEYFDVDLFMVQVKEMKNWELKRFYDTKLLTKGIVGLKEFVNDVLTITPERKKEKGWNYDAIKKR